MNNIIQEEQLAAREAGRTGMDQNVILAQWVNENGWSIPNSNNFGNITYYGGKGQTGYFKGQNGQKFATYANPTAGADAYGNLINTSYSDVATAGGPAQQIQALQKSPWDAAHYPNLPTYYNEVAQATGGQPIQPATGNPVDWKKVSTNVVTGILGVLILFAVLL